MSFGDKGDLSRDFFGLYRDPFANTTCADLGIKPGQAAFLWGPNPDNLHGLIFFGGKLVDMGVSALLSEFTLGPAAPILETMGPFEKLIFDQASGNGFFDPKAEEILDELGVRDSGTYCFVYDTDQDRFRFFK